MRYNSAIHIFPEQCAEYLKRKFRLHNELTVRELMVVLKHMGIKTVRIHNNGKLYDVFYKRIIDGIQDFEFINNLVQYRREKQIRDEWSKEAPENYEPELSNMKNASDELLRQDDVYYTNESKQIKQNMKKDNKKALYESIMTSVAREVKKALNESEENNDFLNLINKILNKEPLNDYEQNLIKDINSDNNDKYTALYIVNDNHELINLLQKSLMYFGNNGNYNWIDTSRVTSMTKLFYYAFGPYTKNFNGDISKWDVSNVTIMNYIFYECQNLYCDISNWDTSNVKYNVDFCRYSNPKFANLCKKYLRFPNVIFTK